jgi:hypothetical protein
MTPAEHARLTDRQEFEAECNAVRQRAFQRVKDLRQSEKQRIRRWIETPVKDVVPIALTIEQRERLIRKGALPADHTRKFNPTIAKLYRFNGQSRTLADWARIKGISIDTLRARLHNGVPFATALTMRKGERVNAKTYTIGDVTKTVRQWADHVGISYDTLAHRLRYGHSIAEAIAMPVRHKRGQTR